MEACMIMPVIIISVVMIIHIGITMYEKVAKQSEEHISAREKLENDSVDFARKVDLSKLGGDMVESIDTK